ncbi:hypothetical protein AK830_g8217 [Neonectria ditissima]|uniref:Carrier domain-containing protein n=1 Tax=Neonectria ditissima TaxID=78410 RepID=A0A0P7BCX0_9HYPO|nr:hypothetical protein AK830_g8217 [Neonectria ditissima]
MGLMTATPQLSEAFGGPCPEEGSIWQRLLDSSVKFPERLAVASLYQPASLYGIAADSPESAYLRWSYAKLKTAVDIFARNLVRVGVRRGEALATFLHDGVEFIVAFWAAHQLGCSFVPINPRTLINSDETEHMLSTARATIVILHDLQHSEVVETIQKNVSSIKTKIFVSGDSSDASWTSFSSMMDSTVVATSEQDIGARESADAWVTILFTSGTTSKPKGVPHTNTTLNAFCQNLALGGTSQENVFCSVLPNNHAMGYFFPLHFMMHGGAVAYPSSSFDATAMADALEMEKVTHTALVPTSLYALLEAIETREAPFHPVLKDVCLSGSSVTPENVRQVFDRLGSKGVSTGFGMTEGSPIWTGSRQSPEDLIMESAVISGTASPGAHIRICAPGSREPLPHGQPGEIHQTGPGLIKAYLGSQTSTESFYNDEAGNSWFVTGDQAVMHPDGRCSVTGRYKDMINRGGENIAPAAIEATISRHCNVQSYVVGAPDPIAGEVPIVVVRDTNGASAGDIRNTVLHHLGAAFLPERILTLAQLGLEDVPKTASNKVQKTQLAALVLAFLRSEETSHNDSSANSVKDKVLEAYFKSTGVPVGSLDVDAHATQFADSIAFMRVRDYLRKSLGQALSLKEMDENPTIASQIKLLQDRTAVQNGVKRGGTDTNSPPSLGELEIMFGGLEEARDMTHQVSKILQQKGLNWAQVSAIIPTHDYMQVLLDSHIIDTWNFAISVMADGSSVADLQTGLQKALPNHPVLTSLVVSDTRGKAHYVTLRPSSGLWDKCIIKYGEVDTAADVQQIAVDFPRTDLSRMPGPLFSCLLMHVKETNSAAMIMYLHHIVQDASSLRLFLEDLNQTLSRPTKPLASHTDFKAWADSYHALRLSPAATVSVDFHVKRLRNLHEHTKALYPPAKSPRQAITESPDGLDYGFDAPGLLGLKKDHPKIAAPVVLKAAMALVNVARTGHSHAIICNFEAGRAQFPFVPGSVQALHQDSFEASDVNGPVMQGVCNLIEVPRDEKALALLTRLQDEQESLTKHAHAPMQRIIEGLNAQGHGTGDAMVEAHRTQFSTWVPGVLGEYEKLQVSKIAIRCAAGLVIVGALGGPAATTFMLSMRWDVANYSREETGKFVADLESAVLWLTTRETRDLSVKDFILGL